MPNKIVSLDPIDLAQPVESVDPTSAIAPVAVAVGIDSTAVIKQQIFVAVMASLATRGTPANVAAELALEYAELGSKQFPGCQ